MKSYRPATASGVRSVALRKLLPRMVCALLALEAAVSLTGCVSVRTVDKTALAPDVRQATLDDLLKTMEAEYAAVQTLNMTVNIQASEGGARQGEVKTFPSFAGYIFLRKPSDLHVLMLVPFVRSRALEMVSDGKSYKLLISQPKARAFVGPEVMATPSKNGLENIRPSIIRDALQIPPVAADEAVTLTQNSRILAPARGKKEAVEEPDYDISVLRAAPDARAGRVLQLLRVLHVSRVTLQPYEQDIYGPDGRVQTTISYSKFQKFGNVDYPMSILLKRPLDEYTLQIDITKLVLNQKIDDESFKLVIPDDVPVQTK